MFAKNKIDPDHLFKIIEEIVDKEKLIRLSPRLWMFDHEEKIDVENYFQYLFEIHAKSNGYSISSSDKILQSLFKIGEFLQHQEDAVRGNLKGFKKFRPNEVESCKGYIKFAKELRERIDKLKE